MPEFDEKKLQKPRSPEISADDTALLEGMKGAGLTSDETKYLTDNRDFFIKQVHALRAAVQRHQSSGSKQWRESREKLDQVPPKKIYDAILQIKAQGQQVTYKRLQDLLGAGGGLYARLRYRSHDPRIKAMQRAYALATEGKPWSEEDGSPEPNGGPQEAGTATAKESAAHTSESDEQTVLLEDLAKRNERARARLAEFSTSNKSPGKTTALIYRVADNGDQIENIRGGVDQSGWNVDLARELSQLKNLVEQVEGTVHEIESAEES